MFGHCQVLGELSSPALCQLCLCSWALSQLMGISTAQETHSPVMTCSLCSSAQAVDIGGSYCWDLGRRFGRRWRGDADLSF